VEALNAALSRQLACYRRKTNTYAKNTPTLRRQLDSYWVMIFSIAGSFLLGAGGILAG
jgi:hypothetical protein